MKSSTKTKVLLVTDRTKLEQEVADVIAQTTNFSLCKVAPSMRSALQSINGEHIGITIVDGCLEGETSSEIVRSIDAMQSGTCCILLAGEFDTETMIRGLRAGATGFVLEFELRSTLAKALSQVDMGKPCLSSAARDRLFGLVSPRPARTSKSAGRVTNRERELLSVFCRGLSYSEAADALGIQVGTVQSVVKGLYRKLGVNSKAQACAWATRTGMLS